MRQRSAKWIPLHDLDEVGKATTWWMMEYNVLRSHDPLDDLTPLEYNAKERHLLHFEVVS